MTARTRCGRVKVRDDGDLLYGRRFSLTLKRAVYKNYVRQAILYESETQCLKESWIRSLQGGLNETIDNLGMANSVVLTCVEEGG